MLKLRNLFLLSMAFAALLPSSSTAQKIQLSDTLGPTMVYSGPLGARKVNVAGPRRVEDKNLAEAPGSPTVDAIYIVAETGEWAEGVNATAGQLARWSGTQWVLSTPVESWIVYVADENLIYYYDGTEWDPIGSGGGGGGVEDGDYGHVVVTDDGDTWSFDSTIVTPAALTVLNDATVAAMVDSLFGASSSGTQGACRVNSPTLITPTFSGQATGSISGTSGQTNALQSATTTVIVNTAAAPSSGQVLRATSSGAANWQTLAAGDVGAQASDAELAAIAGLTSAADRGILFTGSGTASLYTLSTAGLALLDDADATAQRATLGLGSLATQSGTFANAVIGPASATDNALVRMDGTTGKLVQNSPVIMSDAGAVTGLQSFTIPQTNDTNDYWGTIDPTLTSPNFLLSTRAFPNPDGGNQNHVTRMGWNLDSGGGLIDAAQGAVGIEFESFYDQVGINPWQEFHQNFVTIGGGVKRPYSVRHDQITGETQMTLTTKQIQYIEEATMLDRVRIHAGGIDINYSSTILASTNNYAPLRQLNQAGNAFIPLVRLASDDKLYLADPTHGVQIDGGVQLPNTGLKLRDTNNTHDLIVAPGSNLTADRTLTITTGDASRTLTLNADTTLSGTNTGDQTITLTGDVTGSGTGSFAATIADESLAWTELADGTAGQIPTWSAAGEAATVATGTAGQVLTSNGAGAAPTFQAAAGGVSDGDKGDVTVSSSGSVWNIDADAVGASEIAANACDASEIATNAVGSDEIATSAVGTAEIADGTVALADMANMSTANILGRATAGTGVPESLTPAQVRAIMGLQKLEDKLSINPPDGFLALQNIMSGSRVGFFFPSTGATMSFFGMTESSVGTRTTPAPTSTNLRTSTKRMNIQSGASANSASSQLMAFLSGSGEFWRGNASGLGGFTVHTRFAVATTVANQRLLFSVHGTCNATIAATSTIEDQTNFFGVGWRSADTTVHVFHNDGSGTASNVDFGSDYPANDTDEMYDVYLHSPKNGSALYYLVTRVNTAFEVAGSVSSNIPADTQFLCISSTMNNGGTASAIEYESTGVQVAVL